MENDTKIVVLIDAENIGAKYAEQIIQKAASYGAPVVRRAYGNGATFRTQWKKDVLFKFAIEPVLRPSHTVGKNVADIALVIDAMDLMHKGQYHGFCIASSDSDFAGLAMRLREEGITVYGFGGSTAIGSFVSACDEFVILDTLPTSKSRKNITQVDLLLRDAYQALPNDGESLLLSAVGSWLKRVYPSFSPLTYGYAKLADLVEESDLFDCKWDEDGTTARMHPKSS